MKIIQLERVSKFYNVPGKVIKGLDDVTVSFGLNEIVAITGQSGSGKSTLLNAIGGIDHYDGGELLINGQMATDFSQADWGNVRKQLISFVFQDYGLINQMSVLENVLLSAPNHGKDRKSAREILERVGLANYGKKKVSLLSGGEKQRVAIARTLMSGSQIILADEPTGNLDDETSLEILQLLVEISKDKLVIIVTHDYENVAPFVTRKIEMDKGKIIADKVGTKTTSVVAGETGPKKNGLLWGTKTIYNRHPWYNLICVSVLFLFSIILMFSLYQFVYDSINEVYEWDTYRNAVMMSKNDGAEFSTAEISALRNEYETTFTNVFAEDKKGVIITNVRERDHEMSYRNVGNLFVFDLSSGRLPTSKMEIALGGKNSLELSVGETVRIKSFFEMKELKVTVTAITTNVDDDAIYFHDAVFHDNDRYLEEYFEITKLNPTLKIDDVFFSQVEFRNSSTGSNNNLLLPHEYRGVFDANSQILLKVGDHGAETLIQCQILMYSGTVPQFYVDIESFVSTLENESHVSTINFATYNLVETEKLINRLSSKSKHLVVSEIGVLKEASKSKVNEAKVTGIIIFLMIELLVFGLIFLIMRLLFKSNENEIGIMKSIGYSNSLITQIYLIGIIINAVIAFLLGLIFLYVLIPVIPTVELIASMFTVVDYVILGAITIINGSFVMFILTKKMLKLPIVKLLKGNK